jgi:hypothetical protein
LTSQLTGKLHDRYRFMLSSGLKYKCKDGPVNLRKKAAMHREVRKDSALLLWHFTSYFQVRTRT